MTKGLKIAVIIVIAVSLAVALTRRSPTFETSDQKPAKIEGEWQRLNGEL